MEAVRTSEMSVNFNEAPSRRIYFERNSERKRYKMKNTTHSVSRHFNK
jgi:hypothetical protein